MGGRLRAHLLRRKKSLTQAQVPKNREVVHSCLRTIRARMRFVLATILLLLKPTFSAVQERTLARDERAHSPRAWGTLVHGNFDTFGQEPSGQLPLRRSRSSPSATNQSQHATPSRELKLAKQKTQAHVIRLISKWTYGMPRGRLGYCYPLNSPALKLDLTPSTLLDPLT